MIETTPVSLPTSTPASMPASGAEPGATPINNAAFYDRLADVQLPVEPSLWPGLATVAAITVVVIVMTYLGYRRYSRATSPTPETNTTHQALKRLNTIEQAWLANEIDTRETVYRLTTVLRLGLGLSQLTTRCPEQLRGDQGQQTQWQQTLAHFEQLRYQPQPTHQIERETFAKLRQWLTMSRPGPSGERDV